MDQPIQLGLTEEKLQLEIEGLKQKNVWENSVGKWIPVITAVIAVCGFLGGIVGYVLQQRQLESERAATAQKLENDRSEAARKLESERIAADQKREEESQKAAQERQDKAELAAQERASRELVAQKTLEENRLLEEKKIASQKKIADDQTAAAQAANLNNLRAEINRANEARVFESQQPYRQKQIELYFEASRAASTIATSSNAEEKLAAEEKFWNLYWGPLSVVEDTLAVNNSANFDVERAMVIFGRCSPIGMPDGRDTARSGLTFTRCTPSELKSISLCLAHTVRDTIHSTWGISKKRMDENEQGICSDFGDRLLKGS